MPYQAIADAENINSDSPIVRNATVAIAISTTDTDPIVVAGSNTGTFQIPAAFTGANVQPKFSNDGVTYTAVGSAISVSANGTYVIPADCFRARYLMLTSGSSEAAARQITLCLVRS